MAYEKKITTFVIDLKGSIHEAEESLTVVLSQEWFDRIERGAELALIQTPLLPTDDQLQSALLIAEVDASSDNTPVRESQTEDLLHVEEILSAVGYSKTDIPKQRASFISRLMRDSERIKRDVARSLNRFMWKGKRYAPLQIADNLYIAEVDSGFLMLQIDQEGKITEQMDPAHPGKAKRGPFATRTIAGRRYPGIQFAQVQVPTRMTEEEKSIVRNAMKCIVWKGHRYLQVLGSGGVKNGQFIYVRQEWEKHLVRQYQKWPEAALAYGGIVTNECEKGLIEIEATVKIVKEGDLGTNDSRGWMAESIMRLMPTLPAGYFYQDRMDFIADGPVPVQAKGCKKVMPDAVAWHPDVMADIIIPDSSIKPERPDLIGKTFRSNITLGIKEVSYDGQTYGGYTVAQHAPWDVIEREIIPDSEKLMRALAEGFHSEGHRELLRKIGAENSDNGYYRVMEGCLAADGDGSFLRHPFVHGGVKKLLASWLRKLMMGGVEMQCRALADDGFLVVDEKGKLHYGHDWMPMDSALTDYVGDRSLCVRFPVRMREDLLPVKHIHSTIDNGNGSCTDILLQKFPELTRELAEQITRDQLYLKNVHVLNGKRAKDFGGDFDFDLVYIIGADRYPNFVEWRFNLDEHSQPQKKKEPKAKHPWHELGRVSFSAMGNKVGTVTNTISSAIAAGQWELQYPLAVELQNEVGGLKHGTRADMEVVREFQKRVGKANWLSIDKKEVKSFDDLPEKVEPLSDNDVIAKMYNRLYATAQKLLGSAHPISYYAGIFDGQYGTNAITRDMKKECRLVNSLYGSQTSRVSSWLGRKREILEAARKLQNETRESNDVEKIMEINDEVRRHEAEYERAKVESRRARSFLRNVVCAWGNGKSAEAKMIWAAATNEIICRSFGPKVVKPNEEKGNDVKQRRQPTGSILFHAFPQEYVNAVAGATGGEPRLVDPWKETWAVSVDIEALTVTKVTPEAEAPTSLLLFQGYTVQKQFPDGTTRPVTEWKRVCKSLDDLGMILDSYEEGAVQAA